MASDVGYRDIELDAGIENARAVQMKAKAILVYEVAGLGEILQRQHLSGLRVFKAQQPRPGKMRIIGLDACSRLLEIQAAIRQEIQRLWLNAAKHRGATALIHISVRSLADDVLVATIAMTQQCAKIGLRTTRHEKRRLGTQHFSGDFLKPDNGRVIAEYVIPDLRLRHCLAHRCSGSGDRVTSQVDDLSVWLFLDHC